MIQTPVVKGYILSHILYIIRWVLDNMFRFLKWKFIAFQSSRIGFYKILTTRFSQKRKLMFESGDGTSVLGLPAYYAPNFEEVEGAYWFGPVRPSVCPLRLFWL